MHFSAKICACALAFVVSVAAYADGSGRGRAGKSRTVRKHHRPYVAKAITGPVLQTSRPGTSEGYRVYGQPTDHLGADKPHKEQLKAQRRQQRAVRKAAQIARQGQVRRTRQERRAMGNQIVAHTYGKRKGFR